MRVSSDDGSFARMTKTMFALPALSAALLLAACGGSPDAGEGTTGQTSQAMLNRGGNGGGSKVNCHFTVDGCDGEFGSNGDMGGGAASGGYVSGGDVAACAMTCVNNMNQLCMPMCFQFPGATRILAIPGKPYMPDGFIPDVGQALGMCEQSCTANESMCQSDCR